MMPVEPVFIAPPTARRHHRRHPSPFTVLVCRGCCCGTIRKHPETDHAAHLDRLLEATGIGGGQLRVVDCLDVCTHSNVVVIRRRGQRANWLGSLNTDESIDVLARWLESGGHHQPPPSLTTIRRPIRSETTR